MFDANFFYQFIPILVSALAPQVTEYVKLGVDYAKKSTTKFPAPVKVGINVLASAALAGLSAFALGAATPAVSTAAALGSGVGIASSVGFKTGKTS